MKNITKRKFLAIIDENTEGGEKSGFGKILGDLNLDSLSFISLIVCLEDEFGVTFKDDELDFYGYDTVDSLYKALSCKLTEKEGK